MKVSTDGKIGPITTAALYTELGITSKKDTSDAQSRRFDRERKLYNVSLNAGKQVIADILLDEKKFNDYTTLGGRFIVKDPFGKVTIAFSGNVIYDDLQMKNWLGNIEEKVLRGDTLSAWRGLSSAEKDTVITELNQEWSTGAQKKLDEIRKSQGLKN